MKLTDLEKKPLLCTNCFQMTATVTEEDNESNLARLKEQASFREKDQQFLFKFRLTCSTCGTVYFNKTIRNVKIER